MGSSLKQTAPIQNGAFIALFFSTFGWVMTHAGLAAHNAPWGPHALMAVVGTILVAIAVRRCRAYWPSTSSEHQGQERGKLFDAAWFVLLLVIGYVLGRLLYAGWALQLIMVTIAMTFVPWSRIPVCRNHFLASVLLIEVAAAYPVFIHSRGTDAISFLIGGWVLFITACFALLRQR